MGSATGAVAARAARVRLAAGRLAMVDDCRPLVAGIDTLNLSTRAELRETTVAELKALREEAVRIKKATRKGQQTVDLPRWRANALKVDFEVQPFGTRKGLCLLTSEQLALVLNPDGPRNFPRAYVELKSPLLWAGWDAAASHAHALLAEVTVPDVALDVQVSRIDLACDFAGWQPDPSIVEHIIGRVVRRDLNYEWGQHERKDGDRTPRAPWVRTHGRATATAACSCRARSPREGGEDGG